MNTLQAQQTLAHAGHNPGPLDGLLGRQTAAAVLSFQKSAGLRRTALLDPATLSALAAVPVTAVIRQGKAGYIVDEIVLHCAATRPAWFQGKSFKEKYEEIRRWHLARGFRTIGYHWLIDRDGAVMAGRRENEIGAHVVERNRASIGVCLMGGHGSSERDDFADNFTPEQERALIKLIDEIKGRTTIKQVTGHNQYAAKACPGFSVPLWLVSR